MNFSSIPMATGIVGLSMLTLGGIVFMVVWIVAAIAWAAMSLLAGVMANDAGRVSSELHSKMLMWFFGGQALVAAAGIHGGLAFFMADHYEHLMAFVGLLVTGAVIQVWSVRSFFAAAEKK